MFLKLLSGLQGDNELNDMSKISYGTRPYIFPYIEFD